jgi:hypothetical protein
MDKDTNRLWRPEEARETETPTDKLTTKVIGGIEVDSPVVSRPNQITSTKASADDAPHRQTGERSV